MLDQRDRAALALVALEPRVVHQVRRRLRHPPRTARLLELLR